MFRKILGNGVFFMIPFKFLSRKYDYGWLANLKAKREPISIFARWIWSCDLEKHGAQVIVCCIWPVFIVFLILFSLPFPLLSLLYILTLPFLHLYSLFMFKILSKIGKKVEKGYLTEGNLWQKGLGEFRKGEKVEGRDCSVPWKWIDNISLSIFTNNLPKAEPFKIRFPDQIDQDIDNWLRFLLEFFFLSLADFILLATQLNISLEVWTPKLTSLQFTPREPNNLIKSIIVQCFVFLSW